MTKLIDMHTAEVRRARHELYCDLENMMFEELKAGHTFGYTALREVLNLMEFEYGEEVVSPEYYGEEP